MTIDVLIADDQAMMRTGLRLILAAEPDIAVVGEAADGAGAVGNAHALRPDVVVMDVRMPVLDGIEATRRLVAAGPRPRVLILTTFDIDRHIMDALRAGASGFLVKDEAPEALVQAIRTIAAGDAVLSPSVTRRLLERFARLPDPARAPDGLGALTARERQVLSLIGRGLSNADIAATLGVSEATVKTHVGHLLTKLGLRDRVQAVIYAYETGLIVPARRPPEAPTTKTNSAARTRSRPTATRERSGTPSPPETPAPWR